MFLAEMGQDRAGPARLIRAAFALLGLQTYFTAGVKEVRAWTIHVGDTAPQAAGVIHTDFERGFIRAQTIAFDDFIAYGGEHGAKDAGTNARRRQGLRRQGRRRDELPVQRLTGARAAPAPIVHAARRLRVRRPGSDAGAGWLQCGAALFPHRARLRRGAACGAAAGDRARLRIAALPGRRHRARERARLRLADARRASLSARSACKAPPGRAARPRRGRRRRARALRHRPRRGAAGRRRRGAGATLRPAAAGADAAARRRRASLACVRWRAASSRRASRRRAAGLRPIVPSARNAPSTWATWWIGDLAGLLIATPIVLT